GSVRDHIFARGQSAGGGLVELARHFAAQAATTAPSRLFAGRDSARESRHGRRSHHPEKRGKHRSSAANAGDSSSGQSRSLFALRPPDRLARCGGRKFAGGRAVAGTRKGGNRIIESEVCRGPVRSFFPFPSASSLERERRRLDGLRTETWKADAVQRLSSRALRGMLRRSGRRSVDFSRNQIHPHPRYRYAIATRVSPPTDRHNGASVEPAAIRFDARNCDGRLQSFATASGCEPADGGSFTIR